MQKYLIIGLMALGISGVNQVAFATPDDDKVKPETTDKKEALDATRKKFDALEASRVKTLDQSNAIVNKLADGKDEKGKELATEVITDLLVQLSDLELAYEKILQDQSKLLRKNREFFEELEKKRKAGEAAAVKTGQSG